MLNVDTVSKIIRATLLSARVRAEQIKVVSLFLVAPFERGKTTMVLKNKAKDSVVVTDISGMGMLRELKDHPNATHLVVNDLTAVSGHRESVAKLSMTILNALAEEGSFTIAVPNMQDLNLQGRKVGIIACCTPKLVDDQRSWWIRSGFLSRMLVLRFDHSKKLKKAIMSAIENGHKENDPKALRVPDFPVKVSFPKPIARTIREVATELASLTDEVGYRKQKQLRGLLAGHAILRGCNWKRGTAVNKEDVDFLYEAMPFLKEGKEI